MTNRRYDPVSYRPFRARPLLAEGLLAVARPGGELLGRVSEGLFRMAAQAGQVADRQAQARGQRDGQRAALDGRPEASVEVGGNGSVRGASFAGPVNDAIARAAAEEGVDAATLSRIAQIESGGNPKAKNPSSSAGGLFQQIDSNAKQYGVADRFDAYQSAKGAARFMRENAAFLRRQLGREPTPGELYLAHQQGPGGAAKLLANPGAAAASVVGANAVRLNGGSPGMTAGQFANLWIKKAENGYVLPSDPGQIGGGVTVAGGTYRPTGSDTIYGRAYDEAGSRTYLDLVESEMRKTTSQLFEQHADDPAGLEKAYGDLKGALKGDHIFPEIEADFEVGFGNMAEHYLGAARKNLADKVKAQELAEFQQAGSDLSTDIQRRLATFDPKDPDAADAIAGAQAASDSYYDTAAARGLMSPAAAAKAKIDTRNTTAIGFYGKQAEAMDAAGVAAMRAELKKDMAEGGVAGIDGNGYADLEVMLQNLEADKLRQVKAGIGDLTKRGNAMADRAAAGFAVDPAAMTQLQTDAAVTENGAAIVAATQRKISAAKAIRDLPLPEAQAYVKAMRDKLGKDPSDEDIAAVAYAESMLEKTAKAVATDPLGHAAEAGKVQLVEIDATTADTLAASLAARRDQAQQVSELLGTPVPIFRPAEVAALKGKLGTTDPKIYDDTMAQLDFQSGQTGISDVRDTFGDKAVDQLQDWQARGRYATPDEAKLWLKERSDPQWQDRVKPLVAEGQRKAREISFDDVVSDLDDNFFFDAAGPVDPETKRAMMNDFVQLAGERYAVTEDIGTAREQAIERMKKHWGVTSVYGSRGGRVMPYPPEKQYPAVGGSTDWLGAELADVAQEHGVAIDNLSLVADGKTKAAVDRGERPGYLMSVIDPATGFNELVVDDKGRPLRHFFDPEAAQKKALSAAGEARRTQHDPWLVFGDGTSIGPFYSPWRPATAADMKQRQKRIGEILRERPQRQKEAADAVDQWIEENGPGPGPM